MDFGVINESDGNKIPTERIFVGIGSRDLSLATGDQIITGVGFKPKGIMINGGGLANAGTGSWGFSDSTNDSATYDDHNTTPNAYGNTANLLFFKIDGSNNNIAVLKSFDSDGFTITWTKTGSPTGINGYSFVVFR